MVLMKNQGFEETKTNFQTEEMGRNHDFAKKSRFARNPNDPLGLAYP
jgi:hypothetical protein